MSSVFSSKDNRTVILTRQDFLPDAPPTEIFVYCCGATVGNEQQHNQDLREIYKGRRILEFITFYHNALHLTRVHCATNKSNKNTGKFASFAAQIQSFLCSKFSTARLEVLPNLRHAGVFQMSTMVNLGIGFQFKSL